MPQYYLGSTWPTFTETKFILFYFCVCVCELGYEFNYHKYLLSISWKFQTANLKENYPILRNLEISSRDLLSSLSLNQVCILVGTSCYTNRWYVAHLLCARHFTGINTEVLAVLELAFLLSSVFRWGSERTQKSGNLTDLPQLQSRRNIIWHLNLRSFRTPALDSSQLHLEQIQ